MASSYSKHEFGLKKHKLLLKDDDDDSRISSLPDEVLVSILSLLTITEAAKTSVLSHRWKKLWTFFSGNLNFDVTKDNMYGMPKEFYPLWVYDYITWMNQVLPMLVGSSTLDGFTLRFVKYPRGQSFETHMDRCVEFAMGKRIQRIELDANPIELGCDTVSPYNFSVEFYSWIKQPCGLYKISALTSVSLKCVNVDGEFIDHLLVNCPLLERLSVVDSSELLNLKVTSGAAALKLKYLEITDCFRVESVEISSAPNLLSFTYIEYRRTQLHVENVPKLVELSIGYDVITYMSTSSISSHLSQLESLRLDFILKDNKKFTQQFLVLKKLRHLTLRAKVKKTSLLGWTSLIDASPCLQKFTLESITLEPDYTSQKKEPGYRRKAQKATSSKHSHQCLKVVELVGFTGCASEVELAMYFFANATSLEQIIIDRRDPLVLGTPFEFPKGNLEVRKKRGLQLKRYLPPGVDLVVI